MSGKVNSSNVFVFFQHFSLLLIPRGLACTVPSPVGEVCGARGHPLSFVQVAWHFLLEEIVTGVPREGGRERDGEGARNREELV